MKRLMTLFAVFVCAVLVGAAVHAQGVTPATDGTVTIKLGIEGWIALAAALLAAGANIQILRQTRLELVGMRKDVTKLVEETLPDQYVRRDYWKAEIEAIKHSLKTLEERRKAPRYQA